ncbi:MAG: hypothetical protein ACPG4Z_04275 [Chitinophagales bacterium]
MYNVLGQSIISLAKHINGNEGRIVLDLSVLSKGTYILKANGIANIIHVK